MKRASLEHYDWYRPRRVTSSALLLALLQSACGDVEEPTASDGVTSTGGESSVGGGTGTTSVGNNSSGTSSAEPVVKDSVFGGPCVVDTDCPEAEGELLSYCAIGWPNGYCTATCNFTMDQQCGEGAVCDAGGLGWCLKFCLSDADCREGYYCQDDSRGCERDPRPK